MKQLSNELKARIDNLVRAILKNQTLNKREIDKLLKTFAEVIEVPFEKFKKRMEKLALEQATYSKEVAMKELIALNLEATIKGLTAEELRNIAHIVLNKDFTFSKWKNKDKKTLINEQYNMSKAIDDLQQFVSKDVRKRMIGSYINGDSPTQMASQLLDKNSNKKIKRNAKTIYTTIKYRARSEANVKIFMLNEKYYDWIKWQTVEDERVDEVCGHLQAESEKKKLKASELPPYMITPSHFNCRCSLVPIIED